MTGSEGFVGQRLHRAVIASSQGDGALSADTAAAHAAALLALLDCPACRAERGLVPQEHMGAAYLACPSCEFWYPIRDEVPQLLPPDRIDGGRRAPLGPPSPSLLRPVPARAFDLKAAVYSYYARLRELAVAFELQREPCIVDIGCSTGSLACVLRPDQAYFGFDVSFESLRFARRTTGRLFVQADAERLPIKSNAAPFFMSREVLEHLAHPPLGVAELRRIGSRGVIAVPTLDFPLLYDPLNWLLIRAGRRAHFGIYGYGHRQLHGIAGWRALIERGGLHIEREQAIGTGLALNAFDVVWHSAYSWRDFDDLPRRAVPLTLARASFALSSAIHRIDHPLLPRRAASQGFAVSAGPPERGDGTTVPI